MEKQNLKYTDKQILEFVRNRKMHQRVFEWAGSEVLPGIRAMMKRIGNASEGDVRTFFLTALSDFFQKLEDSEYKLLKDSNLKGLLFTICENQWRRECTTRGRITGDLPADFGVSPPPEDELFRKEKLAMVRAAVSRLEQPYRGVLVLHEYGELSHTEIAFAAGYSSSGVSRETKSKAIKKLRDILISITEQP